jgi:hypothetical protein
MPELLVFWYKLPKSYRLVYQGGHHNVYCDGNEHIWTSGGTTGIHKKPYRLSRWGNCDCEKYIDA